MAKIKKEAKAQPVEQALWASADNCVKIWTLLNINTLYLGLYS